MGWNQEWYWKWKISSNSITSKRNLPYIYCYNCAWEPVYKNEDKVTIKHRVKLAKLWCTWNPKVPRESVHQKHLCGHQKHLCVHPKTLMRSSKTLKCSWWTLYVFIKNAFKQNVFMKCSCWTLMCSPWTLKCSLWTLQEHLCV